MVVFEKSSTNIFWTYCDLFSQLFALALLPRHSNLIHKTEVVIMSLLLTEGRPQVLLSYYVSISSAFCFC